MSGKTVRSFDGKPSTPTPLPAETPFSLPAPTLDAPWGLPEHGFAKSRPHGARTRDGHALTTTLRRRLPGAEVDWDAWLRSIEDNAVALATRLTPDTKPETDG